MEAPGTSRLLRSRYLRCPSLPVMGIAVFSENSTLLAHAADMWRQRTPAYFYNIADGNWVSSFWQECSVLVRFLTISVLCVSSQHLPLPRGANHTTWYNQTVFNASTNGL